MSRLSLWERYLMLFNIASSPRSSNFTKSTIYYFEKWCKCCGKGMSQPARHETRNNRALYKRGFCSIHCSEKGVRERTVFSRATTHGGFKSKNGRDIDDMVMISKSLDEQESKLPPFIRTIKEVDATYNMLSEKLSAMELFTGEKWHQSKFYYWIGRALR